MEPIELPKNFNPSPLLWTTGLSNNIFYIGFGIAWILMGTDDVALPGGIVFISIGILGILWEVVLSAGLIIDLEVNREGVTFNYPFFYDFSIVWKEIRRVDVRWTVFSLCLANCVVIETAEGKIERFPLFYFKKQDLSQLFHLMRSENPGIEFTQNTMDRLRIWGA